MAPYAIPFEGIAIHNEHGFVYLSLPQEYAGWVQARLKEAGIHSTAVIDPPDGYAWVEPWTNLSPERLHAILAGENTLAAGEHEV